MADLRLESQDLETKQYIVVQIGNEKYGIDINFIDNIVRMQKITRVPKVQSYFKGIINLRGEVLPIYSLRRKFGLEEIPVNDQTKIIVTTSNGVTIAFKVDEVKEIIDCTVDKLSQFPVIARTRETDYVDMVANHNGRLILLLNQDKILAKQEAEAISDFVSELQ